MHLNDLLLHSPAFQYINSNVSQVPLFHENKISSVELSDILAHIFIFDAHFRRSFGMDGRPVIPDTLLDLLFSPQHMSQVMDTRKTRQQNICWHSFENSDSPIYFQLVYNVLKILKIYSAINPSFFFNSRKKDNSDHKPLPRFGSFYQGRVPYDMNIIITQKKTNAI
jgi:hypothetical protein